jgi:cytoskeletal protein RodZ
MSETLESIGKTLLDYRRKHHITLKMVCDDLKLSEKYIKKIESGILDDELPSKSVERFLRIYVEYLTRDNNLIIQYNEFVNSTGVEGEDTSMTSERFDIKVSNVWVYLLLFLSFMIVYNFIDGRANKHSLEQVSVDNLVFY